MESSNLKLVFICGENFGSRIVLEQLNFLASVQEVTIFITDGLYYRKNFVQSVLKIFREASLIFVSIRFLELIGFLISRKTVTSLAKESGWEIIRTRDINSPEVLNAIRLKKSDFVFSFNTFHILGEDLINCCKSGVVGFHPSLLPSYRGLEPFFWVLANQENQTGITLFSVSQKIDAGNIIFQKVLELSRSERMSKLYIILNQLGGSAINDYILGNLKNLESIEIPRTVNSYFPMPTREGMRKFRATQHRLIF